MASMLRGAWTPACTKVAIPCRAQFSCFFSTFASSVEHARYIYCMFAIVCISVTTGGPTTDAQFGECVRAIQVVASQYQQKTKHHCLACLWVGRASCMTWANRGKQTTAKSWCILLWARKASLSCIRFVAYHLGQQKTANDDLNQAAKHSKLESS